MACRPGAHSDADSGARPLDWRWLRGVAPLREDARSCLTEGPGHGVRTPPPAGRDDYAAPTDAPANPACSAKRRAAVFASSGSEAAKWRTIASVPWSSSTSNDELPTSPAMVRNQ